MRDTNQKNTKPIGIYRQFHGDVLVWVTNNQGFDVANLLDCELVNLLYRHYTQIKTITGFGR